MVNAQPAATEKKAVLVLDWNALTEVQAIMELCGRLGITLSTKPDGRLSASGNTKVAHEYLGDIMPRYRGAIIAYLLNLPEPDVSDEQDSANILANAKALDVTIADYCAAIGHTPEHRDRLLTLRRNMAPIYLLQNLCAFRAWLYVQAGASADYGPGSMMRRYESNG